MHDLDIDKINDSASDPTPPKIDEVTDATEAKGDREPKLEPGLAKLNRLLQSYGFSGVFSIKGSDRLGARNCWDGAIERFEESDNSHFA